MTAEPVQAMLARLRAEREEAHRRYNRALTALDRAVQSVSRWPDPAPPLDGARLDRARDSSKILPDGAPALPGGWRGRLAGFVWRLVGPIFQRQLVFNTVLVDHLHDHVRAHADAREALAQSMSTVREEFERLVRFESLLVQFLQQITPLVDTKERATIGELRPVHETIDELRADLHELRAGLRDAGSAIEDLRAVTAIEQRGSAMTRRELARISTRVDPDRTGGQGAGVGQAGGGSAAESLPAFEPAALEAYKYVAFEDCFRGSEAEIRERVADYVPWFEGRSNVLDIGCGRGELLDVLRAKGVPARGLDANAEMVEVCRARGLDASVGDALAYVSALPDESLGGLAAIQIVEHLEPGYLTSLLQTAFHKLQPDARIVIETINPACWVAFFESYIRDLTHVRPVHPETLRYLLRACGFSDVEIVYRSPVAAEGRLQRVTDRPHAGDAPVDPLTEIVTAFNRNVDSLNDRIFASLDYAAIGRRP